MIDIAISPDGRMLASIGFASFGQTIHLWDVAARRPIVDYPGHQQGIRVVSVASDGKTVATGGSDGMVCLWQAQTGRRLAVLRPGGGQVESVAFSPGDKLLAACFDARSISTSRRPAGKYLIWPAVGGGYLRRLHAGRPFAGRRQLGRNSGPADGPRRRASSDPYAGR